jgi:murein DD-endopeptidase MepM/ murein hydrolase activator NlpD
MPGKEKDYPLLSRFILIKEFFVALSAYINKRLFAYFYRFENAKGVVVGGLTAKRGKYVRPFLHSSMTGLFLLGLALAPFLKGVIAEEEEGTGVVYGAAGTGGAILGQSIEVQAAAMGTMKSVKPRDSVVSYTVLADETLSTIAKKFNVTTDSLRWQNNLRSENDIKIGQVLEVPPIDGVVHKVKRGDTIYSIAKKYAVDPQAIVNWPFNSYTDDENFGLAVGQALMVPDGVMPREKLWQQPKYLAGKATPNAGAVSATGQFVWPTSGRITQRFIWYHKGLDIANNASPDILAADSGTVIVAGWPDNAGYANRVIIDHGNGFVTLYAHMRAVYVTEGQTVNRGDPIGGMGSTGRSTGIHLHFEIRYNGVFMDPLQYL